MDDTDPKCRYISLEDMQAAKRRKLNAKTKTDEQNVFKRLSKHDIKNALTHPDLPLSDRVHGVYGMTPPELLHSSGSGLIMYQFQVLSEAMDDENKAIFDDLHRKVSFAISRQSEIDFPRGSVRNSPLDGTKRQSTERRGDQFRLLCMTYTIRGCDTLTLALEQFNVSIEEMRSFLKLYLAMEEWFHTVNSKQKVRSARTQIAKVLRQLKKFSRDLTARVTTYPNSTG